MGQDGMGSMSSMKMRMPKNSIPMLGGPGPFAQIDMGGMFTILKVRTKPEQEDGTGWYVHPKGTVAEAAPEDRMRADGIDPERQS
jgi:hypothetical protein